MFLTPSSIRPSSIKSSNRGRSNPQRFADDARQRILSLRLASSAWPSGRYCGRSARNSERAFARSRNTRGFAVPLSRLATGRRRFARKRIATDRRQALARRSPGTLRAMAIQLAGQWIVFSRRPSPPRPPGTPLFCRPRTRDSRLCERWFLGMSYERAGDCIDIRQRARCW